MQKITLQVMFWIAASHILSLYVMHRKLKPNIAIGTYKVTSTNQTDPILTLPVCNPTVFHALQLDL
uniref:Uncharacterized protein n=1 Tax=Arundo donax TaxID=35708 RepID=A0A0A9SMX8_ARUDO